MAQDVVNIVCVNLRLPPLYLVSKSPLSMVTWGRAGLYRVHFPFSRVFFN